MSLSTPEIKTVSSSGTVQGGLYQSVEFIFAADFEGTICGEAVDASLMATYGPFEAQKGCKLNEIVYTVSAGSMQILTVA